MQLGRKGDRESGNFSAFLFWNGMDRKESMGKPTDRRAPPPPPQSRTTRLDVAAFLLCRGFQIALVDLQGSTATFIFDDPEQRAESTMREFYNGGQVTASEYAAAQKQTRDLMWAAKRRLAS
jgi:hypothetical protein